MITQHVRILNPTTWAVVGQCDGPTATGDCPQVGENDIVPCAACLIAPPNADPQHWPLRVQPNARSCPLGWRRSAAVWLAQAEDFRKKWHTGLTNEIAYVMMRAEDGDRRYKKMTPSELERIARLRWSLSPVARYLAGQEQEYTRLAQAYLAFARFHPYRLQEEPPAPHG